MAKPVCPECGSTNVVASLSKNSHDNCVACGHSDFVVRFYEPKPKPVSESYQPTPRRYWWKDKDEAE